MTRSLCRCAGAAALSLAALSPAIAQTVAIREINPTHSDTGGNAATGGRVNHLARATDTIYYAASEFGGLFKSIDAGRTWTRLDGHLPTKASDVEASPADPDRVIATSRYDGRVNSLAGINVSTDGGATWTRPASASPPAGFCFSTSLNEPSAFGIAFDQDDPTHVFVGTNCGLARSTDGGLTWTFVNPRPNALATNVFGVVVHHAGIIDTCGSAGHRRSVDGGVTWTGAQAGGQPLPNGVCSIAASPDESYVLFATSGISIFETDNGGGTWNTQFANPAPQGRVPFVTTHRRQTGFDLWFGDVRLFRAGCTTPAAPAPGGAARCPASAAWVAAIAGAHSDLGDVVFTNPPRINVTACRQDCTNTRTACVSDCTELRNDCMSEVGTPGGPLASQCAQAFSGCRTGCTNRFNSCNAVCNRPQEGCPIVMASDGGTYVNTLTTTPACQAPAWTQPDVTTRGLWLFSLAGAHIPLSRTREDLYMGAQDDGTFATQTSGAATPAWTNPDCCDSTDMVPDGAQVLFSLCCFNMGRSNRIFKANPSFGTRPEIPTYPAGNVPRGGFVEVLASFGTNRYAMITNSGIFAAQDVTANPIAWTALGTNAPTNACGLWSAGPAANPTFFALTGGGCSGNSPSTLLRYNGTSTTGTWQTVALPAGAGGVGVFTVDRTNANRLFVSAFTATGVHLFRSADGGATWQADTTLDGLMNGSGSFRMQTSSYAQPTLVAFDPNDANNLVAGAADAGLFLSRDNGGSWSTLTSNAGTASNPVIPRPHWAYFDRECSQYSIDIGTQGRGAWHMTYPDPAGVTVPACQAACDATQTSCQSDCVSERNSCMAEVGTAGGPLASQCAQRFQACRTTCSNTRNACRQRCVDCPR